VCLERKRSDSMNPTAASIRGTQRHSTIMSLSWIVAFCGLRFLGMGCETNLLRTQFDPFKQSSAHDRMQLTVIDRNR
jgi:hypothetical protein